MTLLDAHLVSAAGEGDRAAQERLLSLYAPVTRRIVRRTLSRRFPLWEDGDARQVAELSCVECAARCPDTAGFAGYYVTAAVRRCIEERRFYAPAFVIPRGEAAPDAEALEEGMALTPSPEEGLLQSEHGARIGALVDTLPETLRAVIVRRYGLYGREPETQKQVGLALRITQQAVNHRERRALEALRQKVRMN
jgi:RNA polymerase sigma factor (sigma-70 family)